MISCFKGGASGMWENGINNTHAAVYTSVSDFNQDQVPKISKIIESLREYDIFKYSAYRTAFKLRTIQKASKLHMVDLSVILSVLKDYECSSSSLDETITPAKVENLICTLYTEAGKKTGITGEPNVMALLFLAFLQNTFVENDKPLLFFHVKVALTLFSSAKLSEKYKYFFHYCSNGSTASKNDIHVLFNCLSKMAEIVGEQVTFGSYLVPAAVKNLLKFSKGKITLKKFQKWLLMEPQTLVWISTLHRISMSETTQHFVSCDYCRVNPLVGLRYRCLQCINYNLCQNCFLCGHLNKRHKERHEVQEFVHPATTWEETKAAINALKNKLPFVRCSSKPYLSFDEESLFESTKDTAKDSFKNSLINLTLKKTTAAYIVKELSSIINKLEDDKKQISVADEDTNKENEHNNGQKEIAGKELPIGESLQNFKSSLDLQLERLKELLKSLQTPGSVHKEIPNFVSPVAHVPFNKMDRYFESTPLNSAVELNKGQVPSSDSCGISNGALEKQRNYSTSLDFTNVMSSCKSELLTDSTRLRSFSSISQPSENHSVSSSLELSKLNSSSPFNLSEKLAELGASKISPIYLNSSSSGFDESSSRRSVECNLSVTPMRNSASVPSLSKTSSSTFTLNQDQSLEAMELELQAMLQQIETLLPRVSGLSNDSQLEKEKVKNALSDMETAVKKLSHLSLTLSTGSTDL